MILITGGSFQGKKDYVKNLYNVKENDLVDGASCPLDAIYEAKVFDHFHEYLKRLMENGNAPQAAELAEKLFLKNPEIILITNELGCGIVPMERFDRDFREYTGRVCCEIVKRSSKVYRVICGIGTVIKDDKNNTDQTF